MVSALLVGLQTKAQLATNVPGVFPNTNVVYSFPALSFAQGTCNDGTNTYWFGTTTLDQKDAQYDNTGPHNNSPAAGLAGFANVHLGDGDYYQGYIYVPMESGVQSPGYPLGRYSIDVAIFTAPDLARCAAISVSNEMLECSALCIDPVFSNSITLFAASYNSRSTNDAIYQYTVTSLTNLVFVRALPMSQSLPEIQGIVCVGGMLYVMSDNNSAGEVYQVNPTNGVVVHLAELNIANDGEWEGLDYFHGFLVANEGRTGTANWFDFFGILSQTITGSVLDGNNNPIVGVGVNATASIDGVNYQTDTADTDTNGNYTLNVPNGNWSVVVNCSGGNDSLGSLGNYYCPNNQNVNVASNNATANFIVQICNGVSITTPSQLPAGGVGVFYNQTLQASSCNPDLCTWTIHRRFPAFGIVAVQRRNPFRHAVSFRQLV